MNITAYDKMMFNTDGSSASFYEQGLIDQMIRIAIEKGVPLIDAYNMGTINAARYYNIEYLHGNIATGRIANINFLEDKTNPTPKSVLAKGRWVKKDGVRCDINDLIHWKDHGLKPLVFDGDLTSDDLQFSMPFGIQMENAVITKPYSISIDVSSDELPTSHDESFFMLVDKKWKVWTYRRVSK